MAWVVIRWIAQHRVCSSFCFRAVQTLHEIFGAFDVPTAHGLFVNRLRPFFKGQLLGNPAHQVKQLAIGPLRPVLDSCGCLPAFLFQHGAKVQPFKENCFHDSDRPAAVVAALFILYSGLFNLQESGFFQQHNSPLDPALTDPGGCHKCLHVNVDEAIIQGWRSKAQGAKVKMRENGFNDDLQGFTALASNGPLRPLEWRTLGRIFVPRLCPLSGQRQDARQAAFAFSDGVGRGKLGVLRVMAATIAGHISTPRG